MRFQVPRTGNGEQARRLHVGGARDQRRFINPAPSAAADRLAARTVGGTVERNVVDARDAKRRAVGHRRDEHVVRAAGRCTFALGGASR